MAKDGLKFVLGDRYIKFKKKARTKMIEERLMVSVGKDDTSSSVSSDELSQS